MLTLSLPPVEYFNEETNEFEYYGGGKLSLEYSLHALALWEARYKKPFLNTNDKSEEEAKYIVECMCVNEDEKHLIEQLTSKDYDMIAEYMQDSHTATTFRKDNKPPSRDIITAEVIYYDMIQCNIPMDWEYRNFNRLLVLIKVCAEKSNPNPKKMGRREQISNWAALNKQRQAAMKKG